MKLLEFYEKNGVPEDDQIPLEKDVVLVIPEPDYDVTDALSQLGLSEYEVAKTWPKDSVGMLAEISAVRAKFVIQVGQKFSKKFHFMDDGVSPIENLPDAFVNLHHHDEFSFKDGLGTVTQAIEILKAQRRSFCCVTNHGSVSGWVKQYKECRDVGIKSIFGAEMYVEQYRGDDPEERKKHRKHNHLILLARTEEGFYNIIRIHNDAQLNGFYYTPRMTWQSAKQWGKGVVATSACAAGEISSLLMDDKTEEAKQVAEVYADAFDEFFIELHLIEYEPQKGTNRKLIQFAQEMGLPVIAAVDSHYLQPGQDSTHDLLLYAKQGKTIYDAAEGEEDVWDFDARNLFYRNAVQVRELFENGFRSRDGKDVSPFKDEVFTEEVFQEAMANTRRVAVDVEDIKLSSEVRLPKLYEDGKSIFRMKINEGFRRRKLNKKPDKQVYLDRVRHEFEVITRLGWTDYFLVMEKIVSYALRTFGEWAVGYGRGCFHPATPVEMENGFGVDISDVCVGQKLFASDGSIQKVVDKFEYDFDGELVVVETDDWRAVRCTGDHKWLVEVDGSGHWVMAKDLREGDRLIDVKDLGKEVTVGAVTLYQYFGKIYDLSVSGNHTYNAEGLAVHNSAAGCLISYCLGLTGVDPIETKLLFERFLLDDGDRVSPPDIDTDFDPRIRDKVKDYIVKEFGEECVCSIGTYTKYKTKAVILDMVRTLGLDVREANQVTKRLESLRSFETEEGDEEIVDRMDFDELGRHYPELKIYLEQHPEVREHAEVVRNQVRNMGKHAAGVIISDFDLNDSIPVRRDDSGAIVSTWAESGNVEELSAVGLVKFDLLGINNLPVISDCLDLVEQTTGKRYSRDEIPIDDRMAIRKCSQDDLVGIFQFENPATKPVADAVVMESLNDVAAVTSLLRPGPRDMGLDDLYARRKHGEPYEMLGFLRDVMDDTYGVLIFQEQAMRISRVLAGFSPSESDYLRKAIGKKIPELMENLKDQFLEGSQVRVNAGDITQEEVERIFELIQSQAGYAFNRSMDTETEVVTMDGCKELRDVREGDLVRCFGGNRMVWTDVVAVHDHGVLPGYEVWFNDGNREVCSLNHKFLTREGQRPLWEILCNDLEVICDVKTECAGEVRERQETSGFCGQKCMDRCGWMLAFRDGLFAEEVCVRESSCQGFDVEQGGGEERSDVGQVGIRVLERKRRKKVEGRMVTTVGRIDRESYTRGVAFRRVLSVRFVGWRPMLDLEVRHRVHNFQLASGVITSNSHAVAYSAITTVELWLKYHFPLEFIAALLNNTKLGKKKHGEGVLAGYINYARKRGFEVHLPNVNRSGLRFTVDNGSIIFSVGHVKNVASSAGIIVANAPYTDMEDFFTRTEVEIPVKTGKNQGKLRKLKLRKPVVDSLIAAGAFRDFGSRNEVSTQYYALRKKKDEVVPQHTDEEWVKKEMEVLGLCLSVPPLLIMAEDLIESKKMVTIGDQEGASKKIWLFGRIEDIRRHTSKAGNEMYIVTITDDVNTMNFFVFERGMEQFREVVKKSYIVAVPLSRFDDSDIRFYDDRRVPEVLTL